MTWYDCEYIVQIEAEDAWEAAEIAQKFVADRQSLAHVWNITQISDPSLPALGDEHHRTVEIDLDYGTERRCSKGMHYRTAKVVKEN